MILDYTFQEHNFLTLEFPKCLYFFIYANRETFYQNVEI